MRCEEAQETVAADPAYAATRKELAARLMKVLTDAGGHHSGDDSEDDERDNSEPERSSCWPQKNTEITKKRS